MYQRRFVFLCLCAKLCIRLSICISTICTVLVLRRGDFIEDRFGQAQRNFFLYFREHHYTNCEEGDALLVSLFKHFGSYLVWDRSDLGEEVEQYIYDVGRDMMRRCGVKAIVRHLHGRQWIQREEYVRENGGSADIIGRGEIIEDEEDQMQRQEEEIEDMEEEEAGIKEQEENEEQGGVLTSEEDDDHGSMSIHQMYNNNG